ncbi:AI-2E family transporter [Thiobacter aerophilum]|uniref:AI-2E family transporter n=1 Tax=Thiobacter aerophilum TaxID=3121275 RepID=A0ABV0EIC6_9BURK
MSAPASPRLPVERLVLAAAVVLLALGTSLVLLPFLSALLWASILCYATWPVFERTSVLLGQRRNLAATLMCLAVAVLLVLPFFVVGASLADNVSRLSSTLQDSLTHLPASPPAWLANFPVLGGSMAEFWQRAVDQPDSLIQQARASLPSVSRWVLQQGFTLMHGVIMLVLALIVAFFIYRDGVSLATRLATAVHRVAGDKGLLLLRLAGSTIKGVVYGILGTALAQGILAGLGFLIAGVPGALLLGLLTFFLSIVPMGPPLVWIPAAIWLYVQGETGMAVFLALWGALVVSSIDNFLKPYLISQGADMPFILVLFGVLGGIAAFGFLGVFLGPTLLAVSFSLLREWSSGTTAEAA